MTSGYYVTVVRSVKQVGYLLGPFDFPPTQEMIDWCRREACRIDPWCDFDVFGFAKITASRLPQGKLNIYRDAWKRGQKS